MRAKRMKKRGGEKRSERIYGCNILKQDLAGALVKLVGEILRLCVKYPDFGDVKDQRVLAAFLSAVVSLRFYKVLFNSGIVRTRQGIGEKGSTFLHCYQSSLEAEFCRVLQVHKKLSQGEAVDESEVFLGLCMANHLLNDLLRLLRSRAVRTTYKAPSLKNCFLDNRRETSDVLRLYTGKFDLIGGGVGIVFSANRAARDHKEFRLPDREHQHQNGCNSFSPFEAATSLH